MHYTCVLADEDSEDTGLPATTTIDLDTPDLSQPEPSPQVLLPDIGEPEESTEEQEEEQSLFTDTQGTRGYTVINTQIIRVCILH